MKRAFANRVIGAPGVRHVLFAVLAMVALLAPVVSAMTGRSSRLLHHQARSSPPELPKHWAVPDFSLIERSGQRHTRADLLGKVWVADFFYTTCPGPCPMMSSRLSALQEKLGDRSEVRLVSISTDPAKDQPDVLKAYAERFKAGPNWLFFHGRQSGDLRAREQRLQTRA